MTVKMCTYILSAVLAQLDKFPFTIHITFGKLERNFPLEEEFWT